MAFNCERIGLAFRQSTCLPPMPMKWPDIERMLKSHFSDEEIAKVKIAFDAGFDIEYHAGIETDRVKKLTISMSKDIVKYVECEQ